MLKYSVGPLPMGLTPLDTFLSKTYLLDLGSVNGGPHIQDNHICFDFPTSDLQSL